MTKWEIGIQFIVESDDEDDALVRVADLAQNALLDGRVAGFGGLEPLGEFDMTPGFWVCTVDGTRVPWERSDCPACGRLHSEVGSPKPNEVE